MNSRAPRQDEGPALIDLLDMFPTEESAVAYLVRERWPDGIYCTKCGSVDVGMSKARDGLFFCRGCNGRFSVTTGTVMEATKLPLRTWLLATHLMAGGKKSVSAKYLERSLKISYRTAWHLGHRIRMAMRSRDDSPLVGTIETDEKYHGGKAKNRGQGYRGNKAAEQGIVQRAKQGKPGRAVSVVLAPDDHVDGRTVGANLRKHTDPSASRLMTDESQIYSKVGEVFVSHETVHHKKQEYSRVDPKSGRLITTNTVEGMFANQERQINGTHHGVSKKHLQKYLDEHDFKYNSPEISDGARMLLAVRGGEGRRLTLFETRGGSHEALIKHPVDAVLGDTVDDGEDFRQGRVPRLRPGRKPVRRAISRRRRTRR